MDIVLREKGSHWYFADGRPCHVVSKKNPKHGMRNVNLRWDRHLGLFPSVTNVICVKHKEALVNYRVKQAIMSCLTLPRNPDEVEDEFIKRVVIDMDSHRDAAANFGTRVHNATERFHRAYNNKTPYSDPDSEVLPYIEDYKGWFTENVEHILYAEKVLVNKEVGYAGTADAIVKMRLNDQFNGRIAVLDTKTQGVKKDKKPLIHDTWIYQLRAYGHNFIKQNPLYINIIIPSLEPDKCTPHVWPEDGYRKAWLGFLCCHLLWCLDKNYFPTAFYNDKL